VARRHEPVLGSEVDADDRDAPYERVLGPAPTLSERSSGWIAGSGSLVIMTCILGDTPIDGHDPGETARESRSTPITSRRAALVTVALLTGLALVGCGTSSHSSTTSAKAAARPKPPPVCRPAASTVIARDAGVGAGVLTARATTGNNAEPECHFRGPGLSVVVNIDSSPQPYQRLERTICEDAQQFATVRNFSPPVTVPKLGLDAAWVPDQSKLLTTDGRSLLTVTVAWRREKQARQIALATLVARRYLGKPIPSSAVPTGEM
jgi:hypothetical protein